MGQNNNERLQWAVEEPGGKKSLWFAHRGRQLWVEIHQGDETLASMEITGLLTQIFEFLRDVLVKRAR